MPRCVGRRRASGRSRRRSTPRILRDVDRRWILSRCDEIVKRFMKAFMKGFTSHGPNWGPGFASATHVLPRRREDPLKPRGDLRSRHRCPSPPTLSIFSSSYPAKSRVFSIDPRKCLVFHHHRVPSSIPRVDRVSLSLSLASSSLPPFPSSLPFSSSRPPRTYFMTGIFHAWNFSATPKVSCTSCTSQLRTVDHDRVEFSSFPLRSISFREVSPLLFVRQSSSALR